MSKTRNGRSEVNNETSYLWIAGAFLVYACWLLASEPALADSQFFPPANCAASSGQHAAMGWDGLNQTSCMPLIYNEGANTLLLNSRVGIGTSNPSVLLHVYGASPGIAIDAASGDASLPFLQAGVARGGPQPAWQRRYGTY